MTNPVPAPNVLLMGGAGVGKTHSIRTLVEAGVTPFVLATEAGAMETLADLPPEQCHWHYVPPTTGSWDAMLTQVKTMTQRSWDQMQKETNDPNKSQYTGFYHMLQALNNFPCDRTGEEFGDVTEWGMDRALILDSLSGLNDLAMQLVAGEAIAKSQPQWGASMSTQRRLINKLCTETNCTFVLISHVEPQVDEETGARLLMPLALGRKNAPELPKMFSDVVLARRNEDKFTWSTTARNVDLKAKNLPFGDNLQPSFKPLIDRWKERVQKGEATTGANE